MEKIGKIGTLSCFQIKILKCRYYCYSCDYNLCAGCADKQAVEKSQQEKLVSCLQNLCDKVRDKVEEEAKQMSIDVEDDIPLIDSDTATTNISSEPSPVPTRGSTSIISSISKHIVLPIKVKIQNIHHLINPSTSFNFMQLVSNSKLSISF